MKVGIAGFAGAGKSTVFQWLTGVKPDPARSQQGQVGIAKMPDARLDWLYEQFRPKKAPIYATLDFIDTPGLMLDERRDNARRLGILRDSGGLVIVLNGFAGSDPEKELRRFHEEMIFADLEIVTNRVGKLEDGLKKPRSTKQKELDQVEIELLRRIVTALEAGKSAATVGLRPDEEKAIRSFQLLTLKPQAALVNISEDRIGEALPAGLQQTQPPPLTAAARFELDLEEIPQADRAGFLQDLLPGKELPTDARGVALRAIFSAVGLQVFFTVGADECRAWNIPKGVTAQEAAGAIHTDLQTNFVRARVISYQDFHRVGSMAVAKTQGVLRVEGKTYLVQDGDIIEVLNT